MKLINFPTIKDRRLKVAVVGCGRISRNHFKSILQYQDDLELVAVCDIDNEVLTRAMEEYKVIGYHDLGVMLSSEMVDLVILCTPSVTSCAGNSC